jgi:hypothetical protein
MARQIVVTRNGVVSTFDLSRLRRSQLYRTRKRRILDSVGEATVRAELTDDGEVLIRAGMTNQAYFSEDGRQVSTTELIATTPAGEVLEDKIPSTLGKPTDLIGPVDPERVLDLRTKAVYALSEAEVEHELLAELAGGAVYEFAFNYTAAWEQDAAFLLANKQGVFALVGRIVEDRPWSELEKIVPEALDEDDDDDDLDFDFF